MCVNMNTHVFVCTYVCVFRVCMCMCVYFVCVCVYI